MFFSLCVFDGVWLSQFGELRGVLFQSERTYVNDLFSLDG